MTSPRSLGFSNGIRHRSWRRRLSSALASMLMLVGLLAPVPVAAQTADDGGDISAQAAFVVNSTGDAADASAGNGVCDTGGINSQGSAECTLRAAIQEANALGGSDLIFFSMPNTEPGYSASPASYTITPASALRVSTARASTGVGSGAGNNSARPPAPRTGLPPLPWPRPS